MDANDFIEKHGWDAYRRLKAETFRQQGYLVKLPREQRNWMDITLVGRRVMIVPVLEASVNFYGDPSEFGISEGRISKLCIRETRPDGRKTEVFNYSRGPDISSIRRGTKADQLYRAILKELN